MVTISTELTLREAREAVGLTRVRLASLAGCSIASLANIEQGAVPKHSAVLEHAWAAIESLKDIEAADDGPEVTQRSGERHVEL